MTALLPTAWTALARMLAAAPAFPERRSFAQLVMCTGFVGPMMMLLGVIALVLAVRRWIELRPGRLAPEGLQRALEGRLHGGELDAGLELAIQSRTVFGDVVASGLHLRGAGLDEMLANVERATTRESLRLGNRVANLARLGGIVLLIGLFGTLTSLMNTLQVIEVLKDPTVNDFVTGFSESLVCVVLGLFVALFCFVAFFWLDARLTQRTLAVRDVAEDLVRDAADRTSRR